MTRFWIGVGILAVLLLSSVLLGLQMKNLHKDISQQLSLAAEQALEGKWEEATARSEKAFQSWKRHRKFAASLSDHEPLEEMDRMFDQMQIYQRQHMTTEYAAVCTLLSRGAEAMGESGSLTWWNFL